MISFSDLLSSSKEKTRVLIYAVNPSISKLILEVLNFAGKEFDFFLNSGSTKNDNNDFVIFETSDLEKAAQFKPTIFFVSNEIDGENIASTLENITPGGIVIYPDDVKNWIEESLHYFRKLHFEPADFQKNNEQYVVASELGAIPVNFRDENVLLNLEGIKLLCQQFGVMEEEFYEAVMSFE